MDERGTSYTYFGTKQARKLKGNFDFRQFKKVFIYISTLCGLACVVFLVFTLTSFIWVW